MAVRVLVDAHRSYMANYYQTFPREPTADPNVFLDIKIPVEAADTMTDMSLLGLMTRMKDLPTSEKILVIVCHGNEFGLAFRIVPGSDVRADAKTLGILETFSQISKKVDQINAAPPDQQAAKWFDLLKDLKNIDGTAMLLVPQFQSADTYKKIFEFVLDRMAGLSPATPEADDVQVLTYKGDRREKPDFTIEFPESSGNKTVPLKFDSPAKTVEEALENVKTIGKGNIKVAGNAGGPYTVTFINKMGGKAQKELALAPGQASQLPRMTGKDLTVTVINGIGSRKNLNDLLALRNQIAGRFDQLEFRSCNTGKFPDIMKAVRSFFAAGKVCAPDVLHFMASLRVQEDTNFGSDVTGNIDKATNQVIKSGSRPVMIDSPSSNKTVNVPPGNIPKTRMFDTDISRKGDEVFIRYWITGFHPHTGAGWLRCISKADAEKFVKAKIHPDTSRWTNKDFLSMSALYLLDDFNAQISPQSVSLPPSAPGDPLGGLVTTQILPFALPLEPEYRMHLVVAK